MARERCWILWPPANGEFAPIRAQPKGTTTRRTNSPIGAGKIKRQRRRPGCMTRIFTQCLFLGFWHKKYLVNPAIVLLLLASMRSFRLKNPQPPNRLNRKERRERKGKAMKDPQSLCAQVRQTAYDIHLYHGHGHLEKVYENPPGPSVT